MTNLEDETRAQIAEMLPLALGKALASYQQFLEDYDETENTTLEDDAAKTAQQNAKDFRAHHDACKVAIAHVQLLIKLAEWAHIPSSDLIARHAEIEEYCRLAAAEVDSYAADDDA